MKPAAEVTQRLGLEPTSARERGERMGTRTGATAKVSGWDISTEMREPSELAEHLIELLDLVEPRREAMLGLLADGYQMDWFCFVEATALEHAVELDQGLLLRLSGFPGPLLIDTYGADESGD